MAAASHHQESCFLQTLNATVNEQISAISELVEYPLGARITFDKDHLYFKVDGDLGGDNALMTSSETLGWQPFQEAILGEAIAETLVKLLVIRRDDFETTRRETPQLNYQLRKQLQLLSTEPVPWTLSI